MKVAVAALLCLATIGSGGALAAQGGGGVASPNPPSVTGVTCQSKCVGIRDANPGARVQLTGRSLSYVVEVQFDQKGGGRVSAPAENPTASTVEAIVPDAAVTGKPRAVDSAGQASESPEELRVTAAETASDPAGGSGGGIGEVTAKPSRGYFMGKRATASFVLQGDSPQDVRVDVIGANGATVRSLVAEDVEPGTPANVRWNGKSDDRSIAKNGAYEFEVKPMSGGNGSRAAFEQYDHIFPVRGKHEYWAGLGDGRGHQGADVGAKCGKRMVAARGGKVQNKAYHGAAGNYLVIDGKGTGIDYMYAHLQRPSKFKEGDKVKTGQKIGKVGDTGNASGCHLHFEMWDGDWYGGGKVIDPMPHLKRWDGWS